MRNRTETAWKVNWLRVAFLALNVAALLGVALAIAH